MGIGEDLTRVAEQERRLVFERFDAETGWRLGVRLRSMAVERGHGVVIDVRRFGQPLFYCALDGTTPDNGDWVRRKINTVTRFLRSSYAVGLELELKGANVSEKYALAAEEYATHGGCFPITVAGAGVIGSITVSGLAQRADHELVVEALCGELGVDYDKVRLG